MSGGVKIGGGSEASSFSPSATPSTTGEANPNGTPTLPDGTPFNLVTTAPTPYLSSSPDGNSIGASSNSLETPGTFKEGAKLAKGIELPSVISSQMVRAFVPGVTIDGNPIAQYQDSQLFLPVYNAAHAGSADNYVEIGPWAPIAIQNVTGAAHLKTEGDTGLFDVVADEPGSIALYFTQLGAHQHETAVNGNGQSNPDWPNQYTLHLKPYQKVWVIDRNGNQILWDDGVTPMALDAGPNGDFSIQVPQTATNQDAVFGLLLDVDPSQQGVQATAIKFNADLMIIRAKPEKTCSIVMG